MKKTKFLKKTAFPAAPEYADGFVPPAGFDFKMSVSLRGKDIKIYGFDGTQWEMIHNADGIVDDFIGNVLHQKYYFESKTGVEQVVRASFLSQEEEPELELDFGTSHESRKFHHIEEVPVYRGGDEGKFLTIRTDGSLAWLGLNESYVVEVIGSGGESSSESAGNISGLEETVGGTFVGSASLIDGVLNLPAFQDRMSIPANEDHQPDGGAIAYSAWINLSKLPDSQTYYKAGIMSNAGVGPTDLWEGFSFQVTTENSPTGGLLIASNSPGNRKNQIFDVPSGISINEWHHVAFTRSASGTCSAYFNGSLIGSYEGGHIQSKNTPIVIGSQFGGSNFGSKHLNLTGQIDGVKIEKVEKTASDILSEYNAGRVASQAPAVTYPIVGSLEDDTVNFSTYYTGTITEEGTFKHGSHSNSMFRSVAQSDDYKIMEDTTITMWVKTPHFTGEKSLIKFGGWSGSSAKGVDILFDSRTTTAKHATGQSIMSSWADGHLIVEVATDTHSASTDWAYRTYFKMPNIRDNEWHQIVVEFSNVGTGVGLAKGRVFVDGVKVTESFRDSNNVQQDENGYQELSRNPGDIVAGDKWISCVGFPTNSEFDGITIEKYLLTDEQIIAKYNAGR